MEEKLGKITIAPEVLVTVAQLTALDTEGVARLCGRPPKGVEKWLGRVTVGDGVRVEMGDNTVAMDLYLVARQETNLLQLGRRLQHGIARAIQDTVGLVVRRIDVHIEDVEPGYEGD